MLLALLVSEVASTDFDAIASAAQALELPAPHERAFVLRGDAALLADGLLTRVVRQHGALDVAIGQALRALKQGDNVQRLGFSGLGDYVRERLGMGPGTAKELVRLADGLVMRPQLAAAVRSGSVSARKVLTILPVAIGDAEAEWIACAQRMTVRELEAAVRAARDGQAPAGDAEERWTQVFISLTEQQRELVEAALLVARSVVGQAAPRWQLFEALCEEFLSAHPLDEDEAAARKTVLEGPVREPIPDVVKEVFEQESGRWSALDRVGDVAAIEVASVVDAVAIDEQLRQLVTLRARWDSLVGHLAMVIRKLSLWRDMQFATFEHYCTERLQMGIRAVEQRIALERRLYELPALRTALDAREVSYEQARTIATHATERTLPQWIERAKSSTAVELARFAESAERAQMCGEHWIRTSMPAPATSLLNAACVAVHRIEKRFLHTGDCLERIARHFIGVWEPSLRRPKTVSQKVRERDGGLCTVPGCSRAADDSHHVHQRGRGGGDEPENQTSVCRVHHHRCIHNGYVHVEGLAPKGLTWELGVRPGMPPLVTIAPDAGRALYLS